MKEIKLSIVVLTASICLSIESSAQEVIHEAKVLGNVPLGNKEITSFLDLNTDCVLKSSPHTKSIFEIDESVNIHFITNDQAKAEVSKQGLPEQVFAFSNCNKGGSPKLVNPDNVNNPYDYAGKNVEYAIQQVILNWSNIINAPNSDQAYFETFSNALQSRGVEKSKIEYYSQATNSLNYTSLNTFLQQSYENGEMDLVEMNLYVSYFQRLKTMNNHSFILFSKEYEDQIVKSESLNALSKRNLLSSISVIKHMASIENWPNGGPNPTEVDLEVVCGGNIIVSLVAGAALGNGPGAAVGILTGLWADYTAGCFDSPQ